MQRIILIALMVIVVPSTALAKGGKKDAQYAAPFYRPLWPIMKLSFGTLYYCEKYVSGCDDDPTVPDYFISPDPPADDICDFPVYEAGSALKEQSRGRFQGFAEPLDRKFRLGFEGSDRAECSYLREICIDHDSNVATNPVHVKLYVVVGFKPIQHVHYLGYQIQDDPSEEPTLVPGVGNSKEDPFVAKGMYNGYPIIVFLAREKE